MRPRGSFSARTWKRSCSARVRRKRSIRRSRAKSAGKNSAGKNDGPERMSAPLNLHELEEAARGLLPQPVFDYYAGGAEDEETLRANRRAFSRYVLRPRVLVDVSKVDPSIELLGHKTAAPVLIAPTAFQRLAHADG